MVTDDRGAGAGTVAITFRASAFDYATNDPEPYEWSAPVTEVRAPSCPAG